MANYHYQCLSMISAKTLFAWCIDELYEIWQMDDEFVKQDNVEEVTWECNSCVIVICSWFGAFIKILSFRWMQYMNELFGR